MVAPRRIQLSRTKGWRKPEGAVVVSRPSKWGNPYSVEIFGRDLAIRLFENTARGIFDPSLLAGWSDGKFRWVYKVHQWWPKGIAGHPTELIRAELAGRDLCCWCAPDAPCHADVLLDIANEASA